MNKLQLFLASMLVLLLISGISMGGTGKPTTKSAASTTMDKETRNTSKTNGEQIAPATNTGTGSGSSVSAGKGAKAGEQINWSVISAGGLTSSNGSFIISQAVAQTATSVATNSSYALSEGFFYSEGGGPPCLCGDADGNGQISITDAVFIINYIFGGGPAPSPICLGDADGNSQVSITDAVYIINFIFGGGPAPGGC